MTSNRSEEEIPPAEAVLPEVEAQTRDIARVELNQKTKDIDQIIMTVEGLLEKACRWKQDHDTLTKEAINMAEIVTRLGPTEEALKEARLEQDNNRKSNEEMAREIVKKEAEIKLVQTQHTKAQGYVTEYLMEEEELTREAAKAKDDAERHRKVARKHQAEINSLNRRLKLPKKEWEEEKLV